ncbi:hypothetical protein MHB42_00155 [Lysinibacillus sp. FSL K6-0232]|uniref:hypothetical protein n=1 Tax=Lysinibacillus sp. FSL K6-0232 TaxID=2921425 RepID=UPI0030F7FC49
MKKTISIVLCTVALVFGIFSFSTNTIAISPEKNDGTGEIIAASDTLYIPEPVAGFDSEKSYNEGEIVTISDSLYLPEGQTNNTINNTNNTNNTATPYGWYDSKDKTITAYYSSISNVPETRYYEEYRGGYWYKGHLKLQSVVASGSGYVATFSGQIVAWIN